MVHTSSHINTQVPSVRLTLHRIPNPRPRLGGRVKVNNVIMRGVNDDELAAFSMLTRDRALDVRFIEWMPFDSNGWNGSTFFSYQEMIGTRRWRGRG